jgi:hypothetical protein
VSIEPRRSSTSASASPRTRWKLLWSSRAALLERVRRHDAGLQVVLAIEAVGATRPVQLEPAGKRALLQVIEAWVGQETVNGLSAGEPAVDPFTGAAPPDAFGSRGRGLWIVRNYARPAVQERTCFRPSRAGDEIAASISTQVDVFTRIVCANAGSGLGNPAAQHVADHRNRGQDPEQPGVDAGARGRSDCQSHQIEGEDEELACQVEGLRLAGVS